MYIEILSGYGNPTTEVTIKIHEGILHNREFTVSVGAILGLIWHKKIPFDKKDAKGAINQIRDVDLQIEDTKNFRGELSKLL